MPAPAYADTPSDYLREILEDEFTLARLLGWGNVNAPAELVANFWLWGTNAGETGNGIRLGRKPLPRWRRYWSGAGELVGRCGLNISQGASTVAASAYIGKPVVAAVADFPSRDDALYYVMCKAAIAYLEAERATWDAARTAQRAQRTWGG